MTDSVFDADLGTRTRRNERTWRLFLVLVSLVTLLPFIGVPWAEHVAPKSDASLQTMVLLSFIFIASNFHVAATGWFYTDPKLRPHIRARPVRFVVAPVLLIAGSALLFQFASQAQRAYLLAAFLCWQLWHYQKQNVGLLSFVAAGTQTGPLSVWERRTLMLAAVAGILGFFSVSEFSQSPMAPRLAQLHQLGALVYLLVPIALAIAVIRTPALRRSRLRLAYLLLGASFFLPTFIFSDQMSATMGYAMAHGLQYLVFMGVVAAGRPRPAMAFAVLVSLGAFGAAALDAARDAGDRADLSYGFALYGAFLGVVMAHFVLDADIWRLREPFQRAYMRARFYFVFDH